MKTKLDAFVVGAGFLAAIILLAGWMVRIKFEHSVVRVTTPQFPVQANGPSETGLRLAGVPNNVVQIQRVTWGVGNTHVDVTRRVNDLMQQRGWFIPCKQDLQNDPKTARSKTLVIEYTVDGKPAVLKTHAWAYVDTGWLIRNANHETPGSALQPVSNVAAIN